MARDLPDARTRMEAFLSWQRGVPHEWSYSFEPPPVDCQLWSNADWLNWIGDRWRRVTTHPRPSGPEPIPESVDECEFGDDEYQWRLRQAGL